MIKSETGKRWMVVEQDEQTLEMLATLLQTFSTAEICLFRCAMEALKAFVAAPESFHLVITNFEMPGMNGVDFRRHLHALAPALNVFLITGSGMFTGEGAVRNGFCGLLRKPFTLPDLRYALEHARIRTISQREFTGTL
jgi:DNA-binding NtrC family response regulator